MLEGEDGTGFGFLKSFLKMESSKNLLSELNLTQLEELVITRFFS